MRWSHVILLFFIPKDKTGQLSTENCVAITTRHKLIMKKEPTWRKQKELAGTSQSDARCPGWRCCSQKPCDFQMCQISGSAHQMLCQHEPKLLNLFLNRVKLFWQRQRKPLTIAFTTFLLSAAMTFAANAGCMKYNVISHYSKTDHQEAPSQSARKDGLKSNQCCTETVSSSITSHPALGILLSRRTVGVHVL